MEELSCVDLIMSWMESDPVKLIDFHVTCKGPERTFEYHRNKKNGSKYESFDADRELQNSTKASIVLSMDSLKRRMLSSSPIDCFVINTQLRHLSCITAPNGGNSQKSYTYIHRMQ